MLRTFLLAALFATVSLAIGCAGSEGKKASMNAQPPLRHVVLFKFKDTATPEQVKTIEDEFAKLQSKIDTIIDYEWGTNESPEGLEDGFTHCFVVTFADAKGRDAYLPHTAHKAFVEILKPQLDKVLVVDYVAR